MLDASQKDKPKHSVDRRKFGTVAATAVGMTSCFAVDDLSQATDGSGSSSRIFAASVDELNEGEPRYFSFRAENDAFLLMAPKEIRFGIGVGRNIVAFLAACTHMGCPLTASTFDSGTQTFECFCHGSCFDPYQGGLQVIGRGTQNLVRLTLYIDENDSVFAIDPIGLPVGAPLSESTIERGRST